MTNDVLINNMIFFVISFTRETKILEYSTNHLIDIKLGNSCRLNKLRNHTKIITF